MLTRLSPHSFRYARRDKGIKFMRLDPKTRRSLTLVSGLGFSIAFCLGVSIFAGVWLDERFQSRPLFLIVGILFGLFGAGSIIYGLAKPDRSNEAVARPPSTEQLNGDRKDDEAF